jgi:hypothetical protein
MVSGKHLGDTTGVPASTLPVVPTTAGVAKEAAPAVVDADETNPSLPRNWSSARKWFILIVLSLMSLMV